MTKVRCPWRNCKNNRDGECIAEEIRLEEIEVRHPYGSPVTALLCLGASGMSREHPFVRKYKEWVRGHLEDEARMTEEFIKMVKSGELTVEDLKEVNIYLVGLMQELFEKYPFYRETARTALLAEVQKLLEEEGKKK